VGRAHIAGRRLQWAFGATPLGAGEWLAVGDTATLGTLLHFPELVHIFGPVELLFERSSLLRFLTSAAPICLDTFENPVSIALLRAGVLSSVHQ
jgi:hypothetical protein